MSVRCPEKSGLFLLGVRMRWLCVVAALWASVVGAEVRLYRPADVSLEKYGEMVDSVRSVFERMERTMNDGAMFPVVENIIFRQCGEENAAFYPMTRNIEVCYELIESYGRRNRGDGEDTFMSVVYAVMHEYGHALAFSRGGALVFDNREDSADAVAAVIIRKAGMAERFLPAVIGAARGAMWRDINKLGMVDEHGYDMKRRANAICWIAGGDQSAMAEAVRRGYITAGRAAQCGIEAEQVARRVGQIMALGRPLSAGRSGR